MRKILNAALIAFMVMLLAGCSATRKRKRAVDSQVTSETNLSTLISNIKNYNITEKGFVIKRGRIELEGTEIDGSFGFNARLSSKGDMLVSVRGPLGIELVRLISVGNDIAAIDRITRTVYVGKKDAVMKKNGMPEDFIKIIFGDLPERDYRNYKINGERELILTSSDSTFESEITLCLDESKVCREIINSSGSDHQITLDFSDFRSIGDVRYASEIVMNEKKNMLRVKLSIEEFVSGYDADIAFSLPSYRRSTL